MLLGDIIHHAPGYIQRALQDAIILGGLAHHYRALQQCHNMKRCFLRVCALPELPRFHAFLYYMHQVLFPAQKPVARPLPQCFIRIISFQGSIAQGASSFRDRHMRLAAKDMHMHQQLLLIRFASFYQLLLDSPYTSLVIIKCRQRYIFLILEITVNPPLVRLVALSKSDTYVPT